MAADMVLLSARTLALPTLLTYLLTTCYISLAWHTTTASTLPRRSAPLSRGGARVRRAHSGFRVAGSGRGMVGRGIGPGLSFVLDPPKFCCVISNKSAQITQNFRAVTACGQRHHKFELLFPQLFERGAEDYVDRGRRGVAGRARSGVQAPGHSLQPIVSVIPAVNDATSGGTASGSMDPPRETKRASFFGLFRLAFVLARRTAQISKKGG